MNDFTLFFSKGSDIHVKAEIDLNIFDLSKLTHFECLGGSDLGDATFFATKIVKLTKRPISFTWNEFTIKVSNT